MSARPRVVNDFPHPVAVPYALACDASLADSDRRWALCFTQYQVLRLVVLAHVSQYLRDDLDTTAKAAVKAANEQVAGLKSPMFSNWVTAVRTLPRQWPALKLPAPFPELVERLKHLPSAVRSVPDSGGATKLPPLEAIVALRNGIAHGGIPDEAQARRHLDEYLPVLDEVLTAFDFLADCNLHVCDDAEKAKQGLPVVLRTLRGIIPPEPDEVELSAELEVAVSESPAVLVTPAGVPIPLDPLLRPLPHDEPLYLYDGHYGIRVKGKTEAVNRYVYYLGVRSKQSGTPECQAAAERLRELLAARHISYDLPKERVHPWTIAEAALDYSRRTVADLLGTKYFPECYEPFPNLDDHLDRFLTVPDRREWKDTTRPRFRNGLLLLGTAGSGKTALLARRVEHLLARPASPDAPADPEADRGNPNVVLFLRGNGIALRPDGVSLFRDVAEKLGVSVGDKGVGSFDELFAHLHTGFVKDQVPGRRLVLVFDALNEAPFAEQITREALQLVSLAARFPWCKVVLSTRDEWLAILPEKMTATEADPRAEARDHLYDPDPNRPPDQRRLPAVYLEPLAAEHAERIYRNHQQRARDKTEEGYAIPACATPWDELPGDMRKLLTNPLYLYLFQRAFAGRPVGLVAGVPELYAAYVESAYERNIGPAVRAVVEYLCGDPDRTTADLTDDDVNALRLRWNAGRTATEIRTDFHPAEMLVHEGFVTKRVREEGGGYRFVYQTVAEYLIYRHLRDEMPPGADEFAYWLTLAKRETAFPEYAGAMLFLLRNWEQRDDAREWIGKLVADGSEWTGGVLTKLLGELARAEFVPGQASVRGERLAKILAKVDSVRVADSLFSSSSPLMSLQFAPTAVPYCRASADIQARRLALDPGNVGIADGMARSLNHLGNLLSDFGHVAYAEGCYRRGLEVLADLYLRNPEDVNRALRVASLANDLGLLLCARGRVAEAEAVYRCKVEICQNLYRICPGNVRVANSLAGGLNNLATLLKDCGLMTDAEAEYRRSVQIREDLHQRNPGDVEIANGLGRSLTSLGNLLSDNGREDEAITVCRRSVQVYEELYPRNPGNLDIANGLAQSLGNLGLRLSTNGRVTEAEAQHRRSVLILEELHQLNPDNLSIANALALELNNLGNLLSDEARGAEAEDVYLRSVQVYDVLSHRNPGNVELASRLANVLNSLGNLQWAARRVVDAEAAYSRNVGMYEELYRHNPGNVRVAAGLAHGLNNLGVLLSESERPVEAEAAYRRSVQVYENLYAQNHGNVGIAEGLAGSLNNLGALLETVGRAGDAEAAYRRSIELFAGSYQRSPGDLGIKISYATSICNVGRLVEARKLVDEVLAVVPDHPRAKYLDGWLRENGH